MDFYLLYYAKDELTFDETQWYWEGANRHNMDEIIKDYFIKWLHEFALNNSTPVILFKAGLADLC